MTLKQRIRQWLQVDHLELSIGLLENQIGENRAYDNAVRDRALVTVAEQQQRLESEMLQRDKYALDQVLLNHESILSIVKDIEQGIRTEIELSNTVRDKNLADETGQRHRVEIESRQRDESLLNTVKDIAESHVEEHLTKLQSSKHRYISCPVCGKCYNLAAIGATFNTRAITICCDDCKSQFEVRPSFFWNKMEVEKR